MNIWGQGYPAFEHLELQTGKEQAGGQKPAGVVGASINRQSVGENPVMTALSVQGQVFWGEILDITSQGIRIQLDSQQILLARLGEQIELNIGQRIEFQVKENQGEQVVIRPLQEQNTGSQLAAERALSANGFSLTKRNMQIVQSMMQEGLPLNRETIRTIMQSAVEYPEADIHQLAAMYRLNIPVTEGNIKQFQTYMNGEHHLTVQTEAILQAAETAMQSLSNEGTPEQLQILNQQLIDAFAWRGTETDQTNTVLSSRMLDSDMTAEWTDSLRQMLTDLGVPAEDVEKLVQNAKRPGAMLADITDYLTEYAKPEVQVAADRPLMLPEALQTFLQSDSYRGLLSRSMRESWSIRPSEMKEPEEVDVLYRNLLTQSSKLEDAFQAVGSSNSELSKHSQNMRENLHFMQELNKQFVYAQVPLRMENNPVNSELFVYTRKKQKQISEEGAKVLLHLDMPSLGTTDILVSLKGKYLHVGFTMEDGVSVDLMREHMGDLQEALEKKGFVYTNEIRKSESAPEQNTTAGKEDCVITEMMHTNRMQEEKRYTFDMRT